MKCYNNRLRRVLAAVMAVAVMAAAVVVPETAHAAKKAVKSITLSKPAVKTLGMKKGETFSLKVKVKPAGMSKKITYSSSKKAVVSVDKKGKLKAKKAGKAVITVSSQTKPKKSVKLKVTVFKAFKKVKKVALDQKSVTLLKGQKMQLRASVSPKNATMKKVTFQSSNTSVAKVNSNGVVTAKETGPVKITAYAADGRGAKAVCAVGVTEASVYPKITAAPPQATGSAPSVTDPAPQPKKTFTLAEGFNYVSIYVDGTGDDYEGISLAANSLADDVEQVLTSECRPDVVTDPSDIIGTAIYAGSIGNNQVIDSLIAAGKLDVSAIQGKRETYKIQIVDHPSPGIDRGLVIAGSDKRGTIYGIYHISELIGVSPWIFWADAVPDKKDSIVLEASDLNVTSKEPSVKYRGIFLNDEAPSLTGWVNAKFKGYNEEFYKHVYELILRCKGNYLWPAMWSNIFSEDGKSSKIANAELADKYGIVMGTSHHEPLCRAGLEWGDKHDDYGSDNKWNFNVNGDAITEFWRDGVKRNMAFENVYTLGMRGEADSALPGTDEENIDLLKRVISVQKDILEENGLSEAPQVLTVYKEVEKFWHGTEKAEGLKKWDALDDVTIMLCDDNFGNMRTLPDLETKDRPGGWGMYYHFDYHGGPTSYEWINTVELNKVWEQMTMAYEHGIDDIWIVNVGDLKPMEMNISYFLDMAYDYDTWGKNGLNRTEEYINRWVRQQFGSSLNEQQVQDLRFLIQEYTWLHGSCKPEVISQNTYHASNYNEAARVLDRVQKMEQMADEYKDVIPESHQAAYFQLVYYPVAGAAAVAKMQIGKGLNQYFYDLGSMNANLYAALVEDSIQQDKDLQDTYNKNMPGVGDKWKNMMSSPHVGYVTWESKGWKYPTPKRLTESDQTGLSVTLENQAEAYREGECQLDEFTSTGKEAYKITLANMGENPLDYTVKASADWIQVSKTSGQVESQDSFQISVDWSKNPEAAGTVQIQSGTQVVTIQVKTRTVNADGLAANTFIYANGYASILPGHFSQSGKGANGTEISVIHKYGKTGESLKALPTDVKTASVPENAAWAEYLVSVEKAGTYQLTAYTAPSNNLLREDVGIYYGVSVNGGKAEKHNTVDPETFKAGEYSGSWASDVKANGRKTQSEVVLKAGVNTIRIYAMDPAFVLQKLVVSEEPVAASHLGPEESYYVGKE